MNPKTKALLESKEFMIQYVTGLGSSYDPAYDETAWKFMDRIKAHYATLVAMMEAYDEHTGSHLANAEEIATHIAQEMDLPFFDVAGITVGALIHDVGKIGVHHSIISKAGPLTKGERILAETHVPIGRVILENLKSPWPLAEYAYQHHERLDGSGYPLRLKDDEISLNVRILAAADVAEALSARRPYRQPWTLTQAIDYLYENSHQFDATVVKCIETYKPGS